MLIRQNKLFSSLYVLGTGLAIAMTMIIAIVYYIKIAPIYPEVNRSVTMRMKGVSAMHVKGGGNSYLCSYEMLKEWFYPLKSAELVTAVNEHFLNREGAYIQPAGGGEQIPALVKYTDPNFFRLFEFEFLGGRPFSEADLASGIRNVVLSDRMARRIFGRTDVVGQTFKLDFKESKVVGVVRASNSLLAFPSGEMKKKRVEVEIATTNIRTKFLTDFFSRSKSLIPSEKPIPIIGPMIGEIHMAPIITAAELTFRPSDATIVAQIRTHKLTPRNSVP